MNSNKETLLSWAQKIGLSPILTFEEIMIDSYVYDGKVHWNSNIHTRKKIAVRLADGKKALSDTRIKQNIAKLVENGLLDRIDRGVYKINERVASIIVEHPTKKGR